jgi:hypothetical protein
LLDRLLELQNSPADEEEAEQNQAATTDDESVLILTLGPQALPYSIALQEFCHARLLGLFEGHAEIDPFQYLGQISRSTGVLCGAALEEASGVLSMRLIAVTACYIGQTISTRLSFLTIVCCRSTRRRSSV